MLPPETTGRLAQLVRMLASENDGEALSAARAMARTLESSGADFHDLADLIQRRPLQRHFVEAPFVTPGYSYANTYRHAEIAGHPDALSLSFGLPLYTPERIESWMEVAWHCLKLSRQIPKKHGGRFLRDFEIRILTAIAEGHRQPTNLQAAWMETVVARCHQARDGMRRAEKADV